MSNVHMAWVRTVCGRIKSDYRYSKDIVYNNFPWPTPTDEQKAKIEQTAQAILDARALYPDSSLADLYDEVIMPSELRKAHQNNDRAVMQAYGFTKDHPAFSSESACVAELMKMYQQKVQELEQQEAAKRRKLRQRSKEEMLLLQKLKSKGFLCFVVVLCLGLVFLLLMYQMGFRITYAPDLENSWNAISATASWVSAIASFWLFGLQYRFQNR